jgi:hypothetical protein
MSARTTVGASRRIEVVVGCMDASFTVWNLICGRR